MFVGSSHEIPMNKGKFYVYGFIPYDEDYVTDSTSMTIRNLESELKATKKDETKRKKELAATKANIEKLKSAQGDILFWTQMMQTLHPFVVLPSKRHQYTDGYTNLLNSCGSTNLNFDIDFTLS